MDADALLTNSARCGRRSRVVLTPRRRRQVSREDARDDGDKKARSPGRARRKPLKPFACGNAGCFPGDPAVTNARVYYTTRAAAGALGTRHSPRPLIEGHELLNRNPGKSRCGIADPRLKWAGGRVRAHQMPGSCCLLAFPIVPKRFMVPPCFAIANGEYLLVSRAWRVP